MFFCFSVFLSLSLEQRFVVVVVVDGTNTHVRFRGDVHQPTIRRHSLPILNLSNRVCFTTAFKRFTKIVSRLVVIKKEIK